MTPEQLTQLNRLQETVDNISSSSSIPRNIETAFRERLGLTTSLQAFPIGAIYINITNVNPATELGYGIWSTFGTGRTLVGYDSGQTEFDTLEETGGAKTHTLDISEIPAHTHTTGYTDNKTTASGGTTVPSNSASTTSTGSAGGGGAHNNLQPYIVVTFWKRTA